MFDPTTIRRILMIRPTALGDVCRTVPCLVALHQAFPQASIDWLVHQNYIPAIAAHPALNQPVGFDRARLARWYLRPQAASELRRWLGQLRQAQYDLTVDLQGLARSGFFTFVTQAKHRLGYANARELAWLGYNRSAAIDPTMHSVDRMLSLLETFGIGSLKSPDMRLYPPPQDECWLTDFLKEENLADGSYAILAPTAQWRCKCWPIERYLELAKRLLAEKRFGDRIVILAARHEEPIVRPLLDALKSQALWPTTTIGQMLWLIARCRLIVCNDSAPLHMAVGLGKPIVTLFGPTDPALVGPYQRPETVIRPPGIESMKIDGRAYRHRRDDQSLMATISIDRVWQKVLKTAL